MEKLYELLQDMPFYKKGEQRTAKEWCNVMQVPNVFIFEQKMKAGQLSEWFKEVEQEIELEFGIHSVSKGADRRWVSKSNPIEEDFSCYEVRVMEAALNAPKDIQDTLVEGKELICIDDLDDDKFDEWYTSNNADVQTGYIAEINGIKAVLKACINRKQNNIL